MSFPPFPYVFPIYFGAPSGPTPDQYDAILQGAVNRLAQYLRLGYSAKPHVLGVLRAFSNRLAEVDVALEGIVTGRQDPLTVGGKVLDVLGAIVGQPRAGLSDSAYLPFIQARIAANHSSGTIEDLYGIFTLVLSGVTQQITEGAPANFLLYLTGAITAELATALQQFLHNARGGGIGGILSYTLSPDADVFAFDGAGPGFDIGHLRGELT